MTRSSKTMSFMAANRTYSQFWPSPLLGLIYQFKRRGSVSEGVIPRYNYAGLQASLLTRPQQIIWGTSDDDLRCQMTNICDTNVDNVWYHMTIYEVPAAVRAEAARRTKYDDAYEVWYIPGTTSRPNSIPIIPRLRTAVPVHVPWEQQQWH